MKIAIGSDWAGFKLKETIAEYLMKQNLEIVNVGCNAEERGSYAFAAKDVSKLVQSGDCDRGILICGTGQGMVMAANKFQGIRAALIFDVLPAVLCREHNNANILCTGAWMVEEEKFKKVVDTWLMPEYNGLYDEALELLEEFRKE